MGIELLGEGKVDAELREIALGHRRGRVPRHRAVAALARSGEPGTDERLRAILGDDTAAPAVRVAAASGLAHVGTDDAVRALLQATHIPHPAVFVAVVSALGQIGDASALPHLLELEQSGPPPAARLARFASALIGHRLNLDGHSFRPSATHAYLDLSPAAEAVEVDASPQDARACLDALRGDALSIEYADEPVYQITCDRGSWFLALNRAVFRTGAAVDMMMNRNLLAGVLARKRSDGSGYSLGCYVLTVPAPPGGVDVFIPTRIGQLSWGGRGQLEEGVIQARVRAVARAGSLPVDIDVEVHDSGLDVTSATFDHTLRTGREPTAV